LSYNRLTSLLRRPRFPVFGSRFVLQRGYLVATVAVLSAGCHSDDQPQACPPREPTFDVQVTAGGNAILPGASLAVLYQANRTETFVLGEPNMNNDVCCRQGEPVIGGELPRVACAMGVPGPDDSGTSSTRLPLVDSGLLADAGDLTDAGNDPQDGGHVTPPPPDPSTTAILCSLWTNGPATVTVELPGYPPLEQNLNSRLREDDCGLETVEARIILGNPEGGI
jgi:hypothetical protein